MFIDSRQNRRDSVIWMRKLVGCERGGGLGDGWEVELHSFDTCLIRVSFVI
jgi:hypothetical protein